MSYCDPADLSQYLPTAVTSLVTAGQLQQACDDASEEADSYMRGRYALPLLAWGNDVRRYTAWIACYLVCQLIGFAPQAGSDQLIVQRYYQAIGWPDRPGTGWFPGIQRQAIHPDVTPTINTPGEPNHGLPQVRTNATRGWQQFSGGKPVVG